MQTDKSLDGIIRHLTNEYGGNVHEKGIVIITAKSCFWDDLKNVADVTDAESNYFSLNEPDQWVCWDFHERRVRATHYTLRAYCLRSWVIEGSLDGESWIEIDRQTDNQDFRDLGLASFAVSNPVAFRFVRLAQTGKTHRNADNLGLRAVEFFGTLAE
jgi:hypothetical protein